ncbi:hypothetical protein EYY98_08920 [Obesumbacterium proteus]|nr:hypothetical protein EYY98_08920 [Obesumbacterium proteus]
MIISKTRKVWFSPERGRSFLTRRAAIRAEAKAKILKRYPTEKPEYDENGFCYYPGFHFPSDEAEKYQKMLRRLTRIVEKHADK